MCWEKLDKAWKTTCKVVLGDEIGDLSNYTDYLSKYYKKPHFVNGVAVADWICPRQALDVASVPKAKIDFSIDEIKDIDTLFQKAKENLYGVGNRLLGNCRDVRESTSVVDSTYVLRSNVIMACKFVAYTSYAKRGSYVFGTHDLTDVSFCINSCGIGVGKTTTRIFESCYIFGGNTDIYYSHYLCGCNDCIFCFFLEGKRYAIGNLPLEKSKYLEIKQHLLEQIRDDLVSKKIKSFTDLLSEVLNELKIDNEIEGLTEPPPQSMEKAYDTATSIIFGGKRDIKQDADFLKHKLVYYDLGKIRGAVVGGFNYLNVGNLVSLAIKECEIKTLASKHIDTLPTDYHQIFALSKPFMRLFLGGAWNSTGMVESTICFFSHNCYRVIMPIYTKHSAYSFWPRDSTYSFGVQCTHDSSFVIRGYGGRDILRCFEIGNSNKVQDAFYSMALDGCKKCMFCFGLMGKNYHILNQQVTQGEYERVEQYLKDYLIHTDKPLTLFNLLE